MSKEKKYLIPFLFFICFTSGLYATHNRAGEITYKHISGYTFEVTVKTYTYTYSLANRTELVVYWGDGTYQIVKLDSTPVQLPNDYQVQTYTARHTYPGSGTYQVLMEDPNRNLGIKNIPNSVNTLFSIKTTMVISPFTGTNTTPVLLNPPIDKAAKGHLFIHNPAAYDADGDSISYELTSCTAEDGNPIPGYELPPASDTLTLDAANGDLVWNTPTDTGAYNIAMFIYEWRNGVKIGRIERDMQINVYETNNNAPVNSLLDNYCVEAGDTIEIIFTCTDADKDPIEIEMWGGPLIDKSATYEVLESASGFLKGKFAWATNCNDARQQPYLIVLKSQDKVDNDISLVDISSFKIKVIHNRPENLIALPGTDTIRLQWDATKCSIAKGYYIYRRVGAYGYMPDSCEYGVPAYTGYELYDEVSGHYTTHYTDDNRGLGLVPGFDYCYMVTAYYFDNAESIASEEVCTKLIPGVPAMLQVSVQNDGISDGVILVSWAMPRNFDTVDDGPYEYRIYRLNPGEGSYSLISTIPTIDLSDTTYIDNNINTLIYPYFYTVKLFYKDSNQNWIEYPGSETASSLYLNLAGSDNTITVEMKKRAPWLNYEYHIFRKPESAIDFDSIAITTDQVYTDRNLTNNIPYIYRSKGLASRPINNTEYYVENISHINTASAIDTLPPCAPVPQVISVCDSSYNLLSWIQPYNICGNDDIIRYIIYYKPKLEGNFDSIATVYPPDTTYKHVSVESLAAVYGVVAVDSFENKSSTAIILIDTCLMYYLPNVFSPDGDGINDVYTSYNLGGFVKKVDMQIFNRFGQLVYRTHNPDIDWDGSNQTTKKLVSSGVYYYVCDVYEPRLTGENRRMLKGFIHVFAGKENKVRTE